MGMEGENINTNRTKHLGRKVKKKKVLTRKRRGETQNRALAPKEEAAVCKEWSL